MILAGAISGAYGLTKLGTGILTLSAINTYTGATTVSAGTLALTNDAGLGTTAGGTTIASGATLDLQGVTIAEAMSLNGGTLSASTGSSTASGAVTLGATSTMSVAGTKLSLSGDVSGAFGLTKTGSGTLLLSGNNTYTGATTVSAGILQLGSTTALGTTASGTTIANGAAIDLNGQNYSSAEALSMTGTGVSSGGAIFNSSASAATFGGAITLATALSNNSIIANAGDITISGTVGNASNGAGLTVGGTGNGTLAGVLTLSGASNGVIPMLTKTDAGVWTLSASNALTGGGAATLISGGTLKLANGGALGTTNNIRISSGGGIDLNGLTVSAPAFTYVSGSGPNGAGVLFNSSATAASYTGKLTLEGNVQIGGSTGTINFTNISPTALGSYELTLGGEGTATFAGYFTGTGSLKKTGGGTWTLSNSSADSTYTGVTTVSGGTLAISRGGATNGGLGATSAGTTVEAGATLQVDGSVFGTNYSAEPITLHGGTLSVVAPSGNAAKLTGTITLTADSYISAAAGKSLELSNVVSGAFGLTKIGAGTGLLSGTNTYSGATSVNDGTLQMRAAGALGSTNQVNLTQTGTLDLYGYSVSAPIVMSGTGYNGAGAITSTNAGTATLSGTVNMTGDTSIGGGSSSILNFTGVVTANNHQLSFVGNSYNDVSMTNAANTISLIAASSSAATCGTGTCGVQNLTLNTTSDLAFGTINGFKGVSARGNIKLSTTGSLTLAAGDQLKIYNSAASVGIGLLTARFINNAGATGLSTTAAMNQNWTVWSTNADPYGATPDVVGGLAFDYKQYNLSGSGTYTGQGVNKNGLIYTYAPLIGGTISGTASKVYDGTTAVTGAGLTIGGITGAVGNDVYTGTISSIAGLTYVDKNAGTGKAITGTITGLNGAFTDNGKPVYGYGFSGSISATGDITPKALTLNSLSVVTKTYDASTTATFSGAPTLSAAISTASGTTSDGKPYTGDTVSLSYVNVASITGTYNNANAGAGKAVTVTGGLTLTGADAGNYTFNTVTGAISTKRLAVTNLSAPASKVYDGTTAATVTVSGALGLTSGAATATDGYYYAGDAVSLSGSFTTGVYNSANVSNAFGIALGGLTLTGAAASNYAIFIPATITPATLTYTATARTSTYGSTPNVNAGSVTGFVAGQAQGTATTGTLLFSTAATSASNVGSYAINGSGLTANNGNYTFVQAAANSTALTINPAALNVTVSKVYDGSNLFSTGFTLSGTLYNSDALPTVNSGSASVSSANAGSYSSFASNSLVLSNSNYTVVGGTVSATIGKATLTVTGANNTTTYNGTAQTNSGATYSGQIGSESFTISGYGSGTNASGTPYADNLSVAAGSGTLLSNYNVTYNNGGLTIGKATLTVTGTNNTVTYNGTAQSVSGYTVSGLVNGETSAVLSSVSAAGASGTNAGSYSNAVSGNATDGNYNLSFNNGALTIGRANATVTGNSSTVTYNGTAQSVSGYGSGTNASGTPYADNLSVAAGSGTLLSNYNVTYNNGGLTIGRANATVTGDSSIVTYNRTLQSVSGYTVSGLVNGETSAVLSSVSASGASGTNAGTYTNTVSGNATDGNYNLTFANGALTINKAPITVNGLAVSNKIYDQSSTAAIDLSGASYSGLISGDSVTVNVTGANFASANAGTHAVNLTSTVTGAQAGNYLVTVPSSLTGTISPAPVTVTADAKSMTYGGNVLPTLTYTSSGLLGSDVFSGVLSSAATAYNGTAGSASNAGTYAILQNTLTAGSNYAISYTGANLTVNKAQLTVTGNSPSMTYGSASLPGLSAIITGYVNGDSSAAGQSGLPVLTTTAAAYNGTAHSGSNVGAYPVTANVSGVTSTNYTYVAASGGTLTVNPATLTYTATTATTTYGTPASLTGSVSGFVNGDTLGTATTGSLNFTAAAGNVGSAQVTGGGLTANNGNYTFVQAAGNAAALTVTPAPLVITANDQTKNYDGLGHTAGVSYAGFVNGQNASVLGGSLNLSGVSTYDNVSVYNGAVTPGSYDVTPAGLTSSNYAISYATGLLTINPAPLTVTARNVTKVQDNVAYRGGNGVDYTGFVNGENASVLSGALTYSGSSQNATRVGTFNIVPGGQTSTNYDLTYVAGFC